MLASCEFPFLVIFIYPYSSLYSSCFAIALDEVFPVVPRVNLFTSDRHFFAFELGSPLNYLGEGSVSFPFRKCVHTCSV